MARGRRRRQRYVALHELFRFRGQYLVAVMDELVDVGADGQDQGRRQGQWQALII